MLLLINAKKNSLHLQTYLYQIYIEMTINIFVFIDSTSLEKYSHSPTILDFYKLHNQKNTLIKKSNFNIG